MKRADLFVCIALVLVTVVPFIQATDFDFVNFDDMDYVYGNPQVTQGLSWQGVRWAFTEVRAANWHPLTWISHIMDWQIYGDYAGGHHATNIVIHMLNVLLVFGILRGTTGKLWPAAFIAAIFAVHPLRAESVAWVSERKDVLSGFFWLASIAAYAKYCGSLANCGGGAGRRCAWYLAALGAMACGLISKPMVVTLPCVLLLLDWWPLQRLIGQRLGLLRTASRLVVEKLPFVALSIAASMATLGAQSEVVVATSALSPAIRIVNAITSYATYIRHMVYPVGLAAFYPYTMDMNVDFVPFIASLLLLCGTTALCVIRVRSQPYLLLGWLWYVGMLVPVIGLVQVGEQALADRYTYLPTLGLLVGSGFFVAEFVARRGVLLQRMAFGAACAAILVLLPMTWRQVGTWRDSESLYRHALRVTKENAVAHYGLGKTLEQERGKNGMAAWHFRRTLEINPRYNEAHAALGAMHAKAGRHKLAAHHLIRALKLEPDSVHACFNMRSLLMSQGELEAAIGMYRRARSLDPSDAMICNGLGNALFSVGRIEEGVAELVRATELDPANADLWYSLGVSSAVRSDFEMAGRCFRRALTEDPSHGPSKLGLRRLQLMSGGN